LAAREPENWSTGRVFITTAIFGRHWTDERGKAFQPQIHYFVGGGNQTLRAALYRLRARTSASLQHHDGVSPAWPISYEQMEPYYTRAEHLYQVHGARGEDRPKHRPVRPIRTRR
jgi:choline dehydrogenase-like flavoprotein